jgi:hypothetical protein
MKWGSKSILFSRLARLNLFALALLVGTPSFVSCGGTADVVELRLFACEFGGIEPRSVVVELTGFDDQGETVETFEVTFDDISASVFEDGFATVGYRKDPRVVRATVRLGWFSTATAGSITEAEAVGVYDNLEVPALGEVMNIGEVVDCSELAAETGDGDPTGDGDGEPTTGDGDGDGEPTTGDGDGEPTTGDGDGEPTTGDGDGDPTTGDGDGDPTTGDGDGDPTTGDGDGDPTTGDGDGDGDGDPPPDFPEIGDPCNSMDTSFVCVPELNGDAGTPLRCSPGSMMLEATQLFAFACQGLCPPNSNPPVEACGDIGDPAVCMCEPDVPEDCADAMLGCTGDGNLKLCFNGQVVIGECDNCMEAGGYYSCN